MCRRITVGCTEQREEMLLPVLSFYPYPRPGQTKPCINLQFVKTTCLVGAGGERL